MWTDKRSGKIAIVAHCLLNQNSRVQGLAKKPNAIIKEVINFLIRNNIGIIQMPCPEITYAGVLREPRTRKQYNTSSFRKHCRKIAKNTFRIIKEYNNYGIKTVLILSVEGSPSCGVNEVSGILVEELKKLLSENHLTIPIYGIHLENPKNDIVSLEKLYRKLHNVKYMPPLLCRLGLHKWRNYGEKVLIVWEEPGLIPFTKKEMRKLVYCKRECLRCGIKEKRKFSKNIDGLLSAAGWKRIEPTENNSVKC